MDARRIATAPVMDAGALLRQRRRERGVTQAELAVRANTTQSAISRIEAGKVSPASETLRELLRLIGDDLILATRDRDSGVDVTLNESNLKYSASDRVGRGIGFADQVLEVQRQVGVISRGESRVGYDLTPLVADDGFQPILQPRPLLGALAQNSVDFVVIGGIAGLAHGSSYPTYDLDVAYDRDAKNLRRLARALGEIGVSLRGAPDDLPFQLEAEILAAGANFTFATEFGKFDILGHLDGVRSYADLREAAETMRIGDVEVRVASLSHLIGMKRRVNRTKDQLMVEEYIAIDKLLHGRRGRKGD